MPWSEKTPMSERRRFIDEFLRGSGTMSDLCASYGISRRVGYKWLTRLLVEGDRALADRSRPTAHLPRGHPGGYRDLVDHCAPAPPTLGPQARSSTASARAMA